MIYDEHFSVPWIRGEAGESRFSRQPKRRAGVGTIVMGGPNVSKDVIAVEVRSKKRRQPLTPVEHSADDSPSLIGLIAVIILQERRNRRKVRAGRRQIGFLSLHGSFQVSPSIISSLYDKIDFFATRFSHVAAKQHSRLWLEPEAGRNAPIHTPKLLAHP